MNARAKSSGNFLIYILLYILLCVGSVTQAQTNFKLYKSNDPDAEIDEQVLSLMYKAYGIDDRGIVNMDAGKMLLRGIENYGMIGNRSPYSRHGNWGDLRWIIFYMALPPGQWGRNVITEDGLIEDRSSLYNVVEALSSRFGIRRQYMNSDWEAKDFSATQLMGDDFYGSRREIAQSDKIETWPYGYYGEKNVFKSSGSFTSTPDVRQWPGPWAPDVDPESINFGRPVPGSFFSSKDAFFVMDDKYNGIRSGSESGVGAPVGLDVEVSLYSYKAPIYEDIVIFKYNVIFRDDIIEEDPGRQFYTGMINDIYAGFIIDPDLPGSDQRGNQAGPWAIDDFGYIDHETNSLIMYEKKGWTEDLGYPYESGPVSVYGVNWIQTPKNLGITGFHFMNQEEGLAYTEVGPHYEEILYSIASGYPEILSSYDDLSVYFHVSPSEDDYPHFDSIDSLIKFNEYDENGIPYPSFYQNGASRRPDVWFTISSGAFNMMPGDTIPLTVAFIGAEDNPAELDSNFYDFPVNTFDYHDRFADMYANIDVAADLYNNNFISYSPPRRPTLYVKGTLIEDEFGTPIVMGEPDKVTLYWDDAAENSVDIASKLKDFQGYRLYKTVYNPNLEELEFELIGRWDIIDGITGWDPIKRDEYIKMFDETDNPDYEEMPKKYWLGNDTGLVHSFIDTNVVTGLRYEYSLVAYDTYNLDYFSHTNETPIGDSPELKNYVSIIPSFLPAGFKPGNIDSTIIHISGIGNGSIEVEIIDEISVTGHTYSITFDTDSVLGVRFSIYDIDDQRYVVRNSESVFSFTNVEAGYELPYFAPYFDGIGLKVINNDKLEIVSKQWEILQNDTTYWIPADLLPVSSAKQGIYELRYFGGIADTLYTDMTFTKGIIVPFQVWNVSESNNPIKVILKSSGRPNIPWKSGKSITFVEEDPQNPGNFIDTWFTAISWPDSGIFIGIDSTSSPAESLYVEPIIPVTGDIFKWETYLEFSKDDEFRLKTQKPGIENLRNPLDRIKVVPNPYIVTSSIETYTGSPNSVNREIRFINLPEECTIDIYTLAADRVKTIRHKSATYGEARWDVQNSANIDVAYGIYLYVVKTPDGKKKTGKIFIIK